MSTTENTGSLLTSHDPIVGDIIDALGFRGKKVTKLSIHFEHRSVVTIKAEFEMSEKQGQALKDALGPIGKTYHLVRHPEPDQS